MFALDRTGAVTYASPSSAKVLGFQPEELLGALPGELIHPDDLDRLRRDMSRALASRGPRSSSRSGSGSAPADGYGSRAWPPTCSTTRPSRVWSSTPAT